MSYPTATLDEVWALFQETDRKFQETDRRFQETDRKFQETDRRFQETDRKFQETDRKFQETDREIKQFSQETKFMMERLSKEVEIMTHKIGKLGNRLGEFVEGLIKPSVVRIFQQRGIDVHKIYSDIEAKNKELGLATQIDLLVVNEDICVVIEVKSRLMVDDVNDHIERMGKFKPLFSEYRNKKVLGAVAGMIITEEVMKYAYRKGFFVIGQQGENAMILNDEQFNPIAW